jgi:PKD domain
VVEKGISESLTPAISANGTAAVGVQHFAQGESTGPNKRPNYRIDVAVRPAEGSWQPAVRVSPIGKSARNLSLGFDAAGDLTAAYTVRYVESTEESGDLYTVIVRDRPASSGVWGVEENINKEEIPWTAFVPNLGENESGDAVVAYQYANSSSNATWAATRQGPNGSWTTPARLTSGGSAPTAAGVSPNGKAYVLYGFQGSSSGESCAGVERAAVGESFSSERCLSPTGENAFDGTLAFLGNDAYFAWRSEVPGESKNASIQGARWGDTSTLPDVARDLDTPGLDYGDPTLVPDDQGSLVAFYENPSGELRAAALDGGPPILLGASVPATATVGQALVFSASFVDLWSGLGAGQPTWSFGDGSAPVAGAAVTHTFTAPGVYTVTLGAADTLGNATSATYGITVTPASASTGPPPPSRPVVTLHVPACPKKLSKKACKRFQTSRAAWQTLTGQVTDPAPSSAIASVQVAVYLTSGTRIEGLSGKRFRKTTKAKARAKFVTAKVSGTHWSLRLPKLKPGTYTILVRATDRAGRVSATIVKTVRLR